MPRLDTTISPGLWRALVDHAQRAHEPLAHIVSQALVEHLQVAHHTLYQVSTSTALVEGIYQGAVRVGTLREHGDLGLGTFEDLDGEMVVVDGQFFQVRSDGSVRKCDDDDLSPFAVVTRFTSDVAATLPQCPDLSHLTVRFDSELFFLGAVLHDLGQTERFMGTQRFEVDGADAAAEFLKDKGVPQESVEVVWDAVALHTSRGIVERKRPEIALVSAGAERTSSASGWTISRRRRSPR
jgi:hypothetical protein